jgi:hypothetical protein
MLTISVPATTGEQALAEGHALTLLKNLRDADISAEVLTKTTAPPSGTRGHAAAGIIGILMVMPPTIKAWTDLLRVFTQWRMDTGTSRVTLRAGKDELILDKATVEQQQALVTEWLRKQTK